VWLSKLVSLPLLAIYLVATHVPMSPIGLAWGGLAGVAGVIGLVLFYRALSAGAMTVVAPVTGVTSAAIPVVVGLLAGERPSGRSLLGGCALLAIALVSISPHPSERAAGHLEAGRRGAGRQSLSPFSSS
jgi:drug/metabolite transporter (DMT)-like permease